MKNKMLLGLFVLPFMLASCGSTDFDMYNQTIRYDSPDLPWDGKNDEGVTAKDFFTQNFDNIDWDNEKTTKVEKHSNANEAINSINDTITKNFKSSFSNFTIKTGSKGTNPKVCGATITTQNKSTIDAHFTIDTESKSQIEYEFLDKDEQAVLTLKINKYTNHSINNAYISGGGVKYEFWYKTKVSGADYFDLEFWAKFVS